MSSVGSIAASGMAAASLRLRVSANNVANAMSSGPLPGVAEAGRFPAAYRVQIVDQVDIRGGGTRASVRNASPGTVPTYSPGAPYANSQGMVASPDVDLATEIVQQMMARVSFAANAQMVKTNAQMTKSFLDILV